MRPYASAVDPRGVIRLCLKRIGIKRAESNAMC